MAEEIKGVTYNFYGEQLEPWQAAQRLYNAGFKETKLLAIMWAVMEGESGGYLKAWHHNVLRDEAGNIARDTEGKFTVNSTDLGFIQKNVVHNPPKKLLDSESQVFVDRLFDDNPRLANGQESANIAWAMYKERGFSPWYAYTNGSFERSLPRACVAVGNFLGNAFGLRPKPLVRRIIE